MKQSVTDRSISALAEIAALRMFFVRASGKQHKFNIRQRKTALRTNMRFFQNMRFDQPLPVRLQNIGRASGKKTNAAPAGQRTRRQMHLGIMAKRLKMAAAVGRRENGFLV